MIKRLIRIYTPFICALVAIIHGVLYLSGDESRISTILGEFTGHSILLILYILSTSKQMCIWYKITNYLLISIHIVNLIYIYGIIEAEMLLYIGIVINIFALLTFLIYRITVGITKFLC